MSSLVAFYVVVVMAALLARLEEVSRKINLKEQINRSIYPKWVNYTDKTKQYRHLAWSSIQLRRLVLLMIYVSSPSDLPHVTSFFIVIIIGKHDLNLHHGPVLSNYQVSGVWKWSKRLRLCADMISSWVTWLQSTAVVWPHAVKSVTLVFV